MKIAICDDDKNICNIIEDIVDEYSKVKNYFLDPFQFYTVESLMDSIENDINFNLIFQDIEFPNKSGVDFGQYLRTIKKDIFTEIVFVSGASGYDRNLFDFQPLYFISKPFDKGEVIKAIDLCIERINRKNEHFSFKKGSEILRVPLDNIIYFESDNREVIIHLVDRSDNFYEKLLNIEKNLKDKGFYRIHKSFVINSKYITKINKDLVVLNDEVDIPISRTYREIVNVLLELSLKGE